MSNSQSDGDPRAGVWDRLREVARPDSRLHYDFAHMHPDFEGSEEAAERLLSVVKAPGLVFAVPDGAAQSARERLLGAGARLIVSTFCMRRGFRLLEPAAISASDHAFAATLDGVERFGRPVSVAEIAGLGRMDLVLTGAAAVSANGRRFGRSYQYFDIEWGLLAEIGVADERTPVAVIAHDVQVTSRKVSAMPREAVVDFIVTPSRVVRITDRPRRPTSIHWDGIDPDEIEAMPALIELQRARGLRR